MSWCEPSQETGLDYFGARYFSGAQGRFTSPDEPFADQGPEDPQSWNLYAYVRDNPLVSVDPTGMFEEKNPREEPPDPIEVMLVLSVFQLMSKEMQAAKRGQELLQFAWNVIGGPHDPGCMAQTIAGASAVSATIGGAVGLGGFALAGLGETVTVPGGVALGTGVGAAAGGAVGMIKCATGGGGGSKHSPKFRPPKNPPQAPPKNVPPGWRVRVMPATADYPNGYWRLEKPMANGGWQGIDPSTMKPGPQWDTHVPLP